MEIRRYEDKDFDQVNGWILDRSYPTLRKDMVPPYGLIADGICAAFLIETDSGFCMFDYLCSNPKVSHKKVYEVFDKMVYMGIERAVERGFKFIRCNTKSRGVLRMSTRYGFRFDVDPYFFTIKNLTNLLGDENERERSLYSSPSRDECTGNID